MDMASGGQALASSILVSSSKIKNKAKDVSYGKMAAFMKANSLSTKSKISDI